MMVVRKASEGDKLRFEVVSVVDGARVNFDGLAETIQAARMKCRPEGLPPSFPAIEDGEVSKRGAWPDTLSERIRLARERAGVAG